MLRVIEGFGEGIIEDADRLCDRLLQWDGAVSSMELSRIDATWPMLSLLVNKGWCVLHLTTARDGELLTLQSAAPGDAPASLDFIYAGAQARFTRDYLNSMNTATEIIRAFASSAPWPEDANWEEL